MAHPPMGTVVGGTLAANATTPVSIGQVVVDTGGNVFLPYPVSTTLLGCVIGIATTNAVPGGPIRVLTQGELAYSAFNIGSGSAGTIVAATTPSRGYSGQVIGTVNTSGAITMWPSYVGVPAQQNAQTIGILGGIALNTTPPVAGQAPVFDGTRFTFTNVVGGGSVIGTGFWFSQGGTLNPSGVTLDGDVSQGALSGNSVPLTVTGLLAHALPSLPLSAGSYALVYNEGSGSYSWTSTGTFTPSVTGSGFGHWTSNVLDAGASHGAAGQLPFGGASDISWTAPSGDVSLSSATTGLFTVTGAQGKVLPALPASQQFLGYSGSAWNFTPATSISALTTYGADLINSTAINQWVASISGNGGTGGAVPLSANAFLSAASGSNSFIDLTGAASGYGVAKFLSYVSIGPSPAAAGNLRVPNNTMALAALNAAGTQNIPLLRTDTNNNVIVGDTSVTNDANIFGATAVLLSTPNFNVELIDAQAKLSLGVSNVYFQEAVAANIGQDTHTSDLATHNLTIQSQAPFATATTNKTPGRILLNTPAPVAGGNIGFVAMQTGGTTYAAVGTYNNTTTIGSLWLGTPATAPSTSNYSIVTDNTGATALNATAIVYLDIGGSGYYQANTTAFSPVTDVAVQNGTSSLRWSSVNAGPTGFQVWPTNSSADPSSELSSAALYFGPGTSTLDTLIQRAGASGAVQITNAAGTGNASLYIGSTSANELSLTSSNTTISVAGTGPNSGTAQSLAFTSQAPGATNGTPGGFVFNMSSPTGSGSPPVITVNLGGTELITLGQYPTAPGLGCIWLTGAITPNSSNWAFTSDTGALYYNAPNAHEWRIVNGNVMELTTTALFPMSGGGLTLGSATNYWNGAYSSFYLIPSSISAPSVGQLGQQNGGPAPPNLVLQPQWQNGTDQGGAANNTPGSLIVSLGAPYTAAHAGLHATLQIQDNSVNQCWIGNYGAVGGTSGQSAIWLGGGTSGITPSVSNFAVSANTSTLILNAPTTQIDFAIASTTYATLTTAGHGGDGSFRNFQWHASTVSIGTGGTTTVSQSVLATGPFLRLSASGTTTSQVVMDFSNSSQASGSFWIIDTSQVTFGASLGISVKYGTQTLSVTTASAPTGNMIIVAIDDVSNNIIWH